MYLIVYIAYKGSATSCGSCYVNYSLDPRKNAQKRLVYSSIIAALLHLRNTSIRLIMLASSGTLLYVLKEENAGVCEGGL